MKKTEKELLQKYTQFLRQNGYLIGLPKNVIKGYVGEFLEVHTLNPEPGNELRQSTDQKLVCGKCGSDKIQSL